MQNFNGICSCSVNSCYSREGCICLTPVPVSPPHYMPALFCFLALWIECLWLPRAVRLLGYHQEEIISVWHSMRHGSYPVGRSQGHCLRAWGGDGSNIQDYAERQLGGGKDKPLKMDGQHRGFFNRFMPHHFVHTALKGRRVIHFAWYRQGLGFILCRAV